MRSDGRVFRTDITGLRALAVVAVVLFHFEFTGFGGGFAGVDIFFVISGFLMTGIVVSGLERKQFSLGNFYAARVRRIVPALVTICVALLCIGWWTLPVNDYRNLGKHVAASLTFLSNFKYWGEAGYFSANSHEKWLLHTWSLSVEWQFYLLLPVFLMGVWKLKPTRSALVLALFVVGLASFLLSALTSSTDGNTVFYLLPGRAWEMVTGGLVFLWGSSQSWTHRTRSALEALGLSIAAICILVLNSESVWPGWLAALPVASAALVLLANRQNSFATGNVLAQWIGKRSYSIYLWHWPVVVGLNYADQLGKPFAISCGLVATLILGHLSYCWIELTGTGKQRPGGQRNVWYTLAATSLFACAGAGVFMANGIPGRMSAEIDAMSTGALDRNPRNTECVPQAGSKPVKCAYVDDGQFSAIVLGDSHAGTIIGAATQAAATSSHNSKSLLQLTYSACPIANGVKSSFDVTNSCGAFVNWANEELAKLPGNVPVIILNRHANNVYGYNEAQKSAPQPQVFFTKRYEKEDPAFTAEYAQHVTDTACEIAKTHPVYLVRPIPEMGVNIPNTARAMVWGKQKEVTLSMAAYHARNDFAWAAQDAARARCGVKILDPIPYLCWDEVCHSKLNGQPLYFDDNHLSQFGSRLLLPMFEPIFQAGKL